MLTKLAVEVGLPEAEFKDALVTRKYKEKHQEAIQHAYDEANIMAVPTVMIGDEVIQGLASKETLERVIDKKLKRIKQIHLKVCNVIPMDIANSLVMK